MKKGLLIGVVLALAVGLAVPAMAVDWAAAGFMYARFAWYQNVYGAPFTDPDELDQDNWFFDSRFRLRLTATAEKGLYGVLYFEGDSARWGEASGTRNALGYWSADRAGLEVKNAYINFTVPNTPLDVRVGIQPFAIRPWFFWYNDGAGLYLRMPYENFNISAFWGRMEDNDDFEYDDMNIYGAEGSVAWEGWKFGAYFVYQDDQASDYEHIYWLGAYADGKIGPVALQLDGVYDWGEDKTVIPTVDYKGYALRGVGSYDWNEWKFGLAGKWLSGGDFSKADEYEWYVQPMNGEAYAIDGDLAVVSGGCFGTGVCTTNVGFQQNGTMNGYWYGKGFAEWKCMPWLKLYGAIAYVGDTSDEGDTYGGNENDDDDIGWEFDVGAEVQIYKNLKLNGLFGYLVAGDALDQSDGLGDEDSIDDPWVFVMALAYTF